MDPIALVLLRVSLYFIGPIVCVLLRVSYCMGPRLCVSMFTTRCIRPIQPFLSLGTSSVANSYESPEFRMTEGTVRL